MNNNDEQLQENSPGTTGTLSPEEKVRDYIEALNRQDLERCVSYYLPDAVIHFQPGVFSKKQGIEDWHKGRFKANMQVTEVHGITVRHNSVILEGTATSSRLKRWRISSLMGTATFEIDPSTGKFRELRFALSGHNFLEGW